MMPSFSERGTKRPCWASDPGVIDSAHESTHRTEMDRGRVIRASASSTTQLVAVTPSNFKLFGVGGPPKGISVTTRTAFLGFVGL